MAVGVERLRPWDWEAPFVEFSGETASESPASDPVAAALELLTRWNEALGQELLGRLDRAELTVATTADRAEARVDGPRTILALPRSYDASSLATAIHEFAHAAHFTVEPAPSPLVAESFALAVELFALDTVRGDDPVSWSHARLDALFRAQERWYEFRAWECFSEQLAASAARSLDDHWARARKRTAIASDWPIHRFATVALVCDVPGAATTYRRAQETALEAWASYRSVARSPRRILEVCRTILATPRPTRQSALQPTFERVEEEREKRLLDQRGGAAHPGAPQAPGAVEETVFHARK